MLFGERGFTLIELLVVITIIGIFATVVIGSLNTARDKARYAKAKAELKQIENALEFLYDDTGKYPFGASGETYTLCPPFTGSGDNEVNLSSHNSGLSANGQSWSGWNGPYIIQNIIDPWGTPYYLDTDYRCTSGASGCNGITDTGNDSSVVVSCGPDRSRTNVGSGSEACAYNDDNVVLVFCKS